MANDTLDLVLIDDETRVVNALSREIGLSFPDKSFSIHGFTQVDECLDYVHDHAESTFLVISDLRMPDMKGSDVLQRIREISPDIQTILLTAYLDIDDIQKAVSTTLQTLLFKPWTKESLEAEVQKALETWCVRRENIRLKEEQGQLLKAAGELQHSLFFSTLPEIKNLSFDVTYSPLQDIHCGGDFYRVIENRPGEYLVIIGDVVGHGPRAALVTTMINTLLMELELEHNPVLNSPARIMEYLNYRLCSILEYAPEMIVSLIAVTINTKSMSCKIANAGHPPLIMCDKEELRVFRSSNPVLGMGKNIRYNETGQGLAPKESLYLFTDGLIESVPSRFRLSEDQVAGCIQKNLHKSTGDLYDSFKGLLPEGEFSDDVTIIKLQMP